MPQYKLKKTDCAIVFRPNKLMLLLPKAKAKDAAPDHVLVASAVAALIANGNKSLSKLIDKWIKDIKKGEVK